MTFRVVLRDLMMAITDPMLSVSWTFSSVQVIAWPVSAVNGDCVEVGATAAGRAAGIRDSKSPERGHLPVTPEAFAAFLASVKDGRAGRR